MTPPFVATLCKLVLGTSLFVAMTGIGQAASHGEHNAVIQKERGDCLSGNTNQDQATCMREAGAAKQEAQRGNLRDSADYQSNASKRCAALPPSEKADCERRAMGEGSASGSVGSGGVVKELVTPVPAPVQGSK